MRACASSPSPIRWAVCSVRAMNFIKELCADDDRYVWLNQYTNANAWKAHYRRTAPSIARQFPDLDVLFVGAGHDRDADGLRPLVQAAAALGADRRDRPRRFGQLRCLPQPAG